MIKYHNLISLFIGLLFLGLVQSFGNPYPIFRILTPVFILFLFSVFWYNKKYLQSLQKYSLWVLFRPLLLIGSGFGLYLLLPSEPLRNIFLVLTVVLIWILEFSLGNFTENLLIGETIVIAYGIFFSVLGADFYFPGISINFLKNILSVQILYAVLVFLAVYVLSRSFLFFTPQDELSQNVSSLIMALLVTEFFWVLKLLPLHFSVLAVLLLNFYYFILILNYNFTLNTLTRKKVYYHLGLVLLISAGVLLSTSWGII